jgi:hypothetical protein
MYLVRQKQNTLVKELAMLSFGRQEEAPLQCLDCHLLLPREHSFQVKRNSKYFHSLSLFHYLFNVQLKIHSFTIYSCSFSFEIAPLL